MKFIAKRWNEQPLQVILFLACFVRLISVLFSKGYGMHDDHFLVIEAAKSWADGFDYNNWLPVEGQTTPTPSGHSFFYAGLHYLLFRFLKFQNITEPQTQMYIVRLIHALLSLITVYCGYKIAFKLSGERVAKAVGLLLAVFWFMPFMSVRNLVEFVCIIPLMAATWLVIKQEEQTRILPYVWAGVLMGIAFSIRFQTVMFTGGFGLALLFQRKFKEVIILGLFFLAVAAGIQGVTDFYIWGKPFVEFQEYVRYNIENAQQYIVLQWYMYVLLILGVLIPPVSIFLFFGFLRFWKKHLLLFLPSFIFLVFHSYFPNKQERFILPIIPFIILLGTMGWYDFLECSTYWQEHKKLLRGFYRWFWCINVLLLVVISTAYSKKNRVESMTYIAKKKDATAIAIEDSNRDDFLMPPQFYLQNWNRVYGITHLKPTGDFYKEYIALPAKERPNYVVFMQHENIEKRVEEMKKFFPALAYETTIEPSFIDKLMHWLNPVNKNQTTYIYKIN
jgi:hypothetical protein